MTFTMQLSAPAMGPRALGRGEIEVFVGTEVRIQGRVRKADGNDVLHADLFDITVSVFDTEGSSPEEPINEVRNGSRCHG